ncbi:MAG: single-stranded-DNA-specific exonuclease RecJ [Spirochaetaceae bacterium]|nr:MAG: single-stranded-DNA-specific exonuclease RecJ [Spirochaetaceae bacterium]
MKWNKREVDSREVKRFGERYGVDTLSSAIFVRRGITDPDRVRYFFEDDLRYLHNPFLFDEMSDAVQRILQAVTEGERVMVFGDRDVDGITSTVVITEALVALGIDTKWAIPMGDEPYGLTRAVVDRCIADDVTLIVAVDCGTSNVDEIAYASASGIDTIVIDHHNPQDELPAATAIINPKLADGSYPFDGLCACALASKVRYALGFAQSDFFNQPLCLLNVRPGNESLIIDAIKIENMVEIARLCENVIPGVFDVEQSRLGRFLQGVGILVYDGAVQERLLKQAFPGSVQVEFADVAPEIWKAFPSLSGKSLLRLQSSSRLGRYGDEPSEIDVFLSVFTTFVSRKEAAILDDLVGCLDLVALGTLADMMPLVDENRILVKQGLRRMTENPRPGLRALIERQRLLGKTLVAQDVGWSLSPLINSTGRMGEPDVAVRLLLSQDPVERERLADTVVDLNRRRRELGDRAWASTLAQARESVDAHGGRFLLVSDQSIGRGITGILAGRLARHFNAPAAVISELDGRAVGSVRAVRGFMVTEFLSRFSDLLDDWGGHDAAGGFHLPVDRIDEFRRRVLETVPLVDIDDSVEAVVEIDAELPAGYLTPKLLEVVRVFAPFGQGNPPLIFCARSLSIVKVDPIGKGEEHLRLTLDGGQTKWPAIFWNSSDRLGRDFTIGDTVDVAFSFDVNYYQGSETPRMALVDVRRT